MNAVTLYQLSEKYRALEQLADCDEIPPEVIRDTLDAVDGEIRDKAVAVAQFLLNLEAAAEDIDEAAEAMIKRAHRLRARAQSLRDYTLFHLQATQITRVDSPYFAITVRNNPPAVLVDNEQLVPEEYRIQPPPPPKRLDRVKIAAVIKGGAVVPGCRLETRQRLEIKI